MAVFLIFISFCDIMPQTFVLDTKMSDLKQAFLSGIKKILLITGITAGTVHGANAKITTNSNYLPKKPRTEISYTQDKDSRPTINYSKVKIRSYEDLERMFDMAMPIIFNTLILEYGIEYDVFSENDGPNWVNTYVGVGLNIIPTDINSYNAPETIWVSTGRVQDISYTKLSDNDLAKLIIGWGKYRTITKTHKNELSKKQKTVLRKIYENIKGAEIRPNELAAIYCATFFNEDNLRNICLYVQDYYNNPIKCANMLMSSTQGYAPYANSQDIAILNALIYLNYNYFCEATLDMPIDTKNKKTCLFVTELAKKTLTEKNYKAYSENCKKELLECFFYPTFRDTPGHLFSFVSPKIISFRLSQQNNINLNTNQRDFEAAITFMKTKDYAKALNVLLTLEKTNSASSVLFQQITECYYAMEQYDNAIKYGQKVLNMFSKSERAEAAYYMGKSYMGKNQPDMAIKFFKRAIDESGYLPEATRKLYVVIYESSLEEAKKAWDELLQQQKESRKQVQY